MVAKRSLGFAGIAALLVAAATCKDLEDIQGPDFTPNPTEFDERRICVPPSNPASPISEKECVF